MSNFWGAYQNALDFQLSSYLGYSICKYPHFDNFVIISKDTGFQTLIDFWEKEKSVKVHIFPNIEEAFSALEVCSEEIEETLVETNDYDE